MLLRADHSATPAPERCLRLYRKLAAGVCVVSAQAASGPVGLTASTVTSLSLRPPLLLAGLAVGSYTLASIEQSRTFGVHLLGERQRELAEDFASATGTRFDGHDHRHVLGVPVLNDTLGWAVCLLIDARRYGDHVLIVGEVAAVDSAEGQPLIWHDRSFGRLHDRRRIHSIADTHDEMWVNGT
ncbi:flavin reductase family protein [Nocardia pseudobrasiliensis]|uniref:Flavin reductase (DIM6/NTAB) family NADH-FMN oxidoreductase RutF n=1 Tax=Nocardia pseudobrasiliensis TaxID=45979 RepID=A0A370IBN7_9NOCA|nr:flavin reductase family protein [Nocardia pseudobrasiliensis]RDI68145.1 flavin reductase (DIM6/NTAB) family NADH-FMN oxidoreductase RutF [Nocardia pseudobrasiliensis]